jgi:ABC-type lipoprotein release transport system permease subunit
VAANVKNNPGLAEPDDPEYYIPRKLDDADGVPPQAAIILRTAADAAAAAKAIRAATAEIDPALPVNVYTMRQRVAELTARPRFNAALTGWFAVIGVILSAIGLYGVVSFGTVQRTQEIGVRLALGATPGNILNLILSSSFRWTMAGMIVGLITSLFTTRLIRTLLFQVPEHDPWTLMVTIILLLTVSLLAAALPSIRASRTDPTIALRNN